MTNDEREIIYKAKCLGAVFKRDGTRWMWQGGDYSYKTRLEAAYDYLEASNPAFASTRITNKAENPNTERSRQK